MSRMATAVSILSLSLLAQACSSAPRQQLRTGSTRLAACESMSCVSSQEVREEHRIAPLIYTGSRAAAQAALAKILQGMEKASLVSNQPGYLHASFEPGLLGPATDIELVFVSASRIDVRAAPRGVSLGISGNRDRVESIRAAFNSLQP